jgi:DNA-binding GntR family transcriptional regulator
VLSGELSGGEPLREQALAARFGVSRGPIRDALLQLTQEGILVAKPNCGTKVREAPSERIQPLIVRLRQEIEVFALRSAFDRAASEGLPRLEAILERLRSACEAGDLAGVAEHDMAFHRAIVEMPGDDDLVAMWLPIVVRMMLHYTRHGDLMESYREHATILDAIRAGKKREAVQALKANTR